MITADMILLNLTFLGLVNYTPFNESVINSTLGERSLATAHLAVGRCSSENGTDYNEEYDRSEIACASYEPYITEQFTTIMTSLLFTFGYRSLPIVYKTGGADVFGGSDSSGECTSGKTCAYERIYAHTDDCRAYALDNERSYWLVRTEVHLQRISYITTFCAVCNADFTAEDAPGRPNVSLDFTQVSNVCVPSSGLSATPPPSHPPSIIGIVVVVLVGMSLVGMSVVAAGVALYIGAKPPTPTLAKFPATFEVTLVGLKT